MYERDFAQIKKAGFDHVRLPVNPEEMGGKLEQGASLAATDFTRVDKAIAMAVKYHLAVILDIHPEEEFVKTLQDEAWAEPQFIAMWVALTKRYKDYPADALAFELLNEPQYYRQESRYNLFVRKLTGAIRKEDDKRTLIVAAPDGSSIEGLQKLDTIDDPHVIYDVHFYEPYMITAQGYHTGFEKTMLRYFRGVPYPSERVEHDAEFHAPLAPNPSQAEDELKAYTNAPWDARHIAGRIQLVKAWADSHKARVICGEFGVLRNHIDPDSRYRWIADVRKALEADGIGWELWDYTDIFGIARLVGETTPPDPVDGSIRLADPEKGSRLIEPAAMTALGLK